MAAARPLAKLIIYQLYYNSNSGTRDMKAKESLFVQSNISVCADLLGFSVLNMGLIALSYEAVGR